MRMTLKDNITIDVTMTGYDKEDHHEAVESMHFINDRHEKSKKNDRK